MDGQGTIFAQCLSRISRLGLLACLIAMTAAQADGQVTNHVWYGAENDLWLNSFNWSGLNPPNSANENAIFNGSGPDSKYTVKFVANPTPSTTSIRDLRILGDSLTLMTNFVGRTHILDALTATVDGGSLLLTDAGVGSYVDLSLRNDLNVLDGSFTAKGGTSVTVADDLSVGEKSEKGTVTIEGSGSLLDVEGDTDIGAATGSGDRITIRKGARGDLRGTTTINQSGLIDVDANSTFTAGSVNVNGGRLEIDNTDSYKVAKSKFLNLVNGGTALLGGNLNLEGGQLTFGASEELVVGGGTVSMSGESVIEAGGALAAEIHGSGTQMRITATDDLLIGDPTSDSGYGVDGELEVGSHDVTLYDLDAAQVGKSTTIAGGKLHAANGIHLDSNDSLSGYGAVNGPVSGADQASILATGKLMLGDRENQSGFDFAGSLRTGGDKVTLLDSDFARLGHTTVLGDDDSGRPGTLDADNGVSMGQNDSLRGFGEVQGKISGSSTTSISAEGPLTLGDASSPAGVSFRGYLDTGGNEVTLKDASQAKLGRSTILGDQVTKRPGTIIAAQGIDIGYGAWVSSIEGILRGFGEVRGSVAGAADDTILAEGNLILGDDESSTGIDFDGTLNVGGNTVTLKDSGLAYLGHTTVLGDDEDPGTIDAPNGIGICSSCAGDLSGFGEVRGPVYAASSDTITATGPLTLGDINDDLGFRNYGLLNIGTHRVTLNDQDLAQLGFRTVLNGGELVAANGVQIAYGGEIRGRGWVDTDVVLNNADLVAENGRLSIRGNVESRASSNPSLIRQDTFTDEESLELAGSSHTFDVADGTAAIDLDVTLPITEATPGAGVVKEGPGVMQFSGAEVNRYTGTTTINGGTLVLNKSGSNLNAIPGDLEINHAGVVRTERGQQISDNRTVAISGTGTLDLNGNYESILRLEMSGGSVAGGTLQVNGVVTGLPASTTATIASDTLMLAGTRTFDIADGPETPHVDMRISAEITNGGLRKQGDGILELTRANSYTGITDIEGGTLLVNNPNPIPHPDYSATGFGAVYVQNGATLAGRGAIFGPVYMDRGTIAPGDGTGKLLIDRLGDMDFDSTLHVELNGRTQGSNYDLLEVTRDAYIDGNIDVTLLSNFQDFIRHTDEFTVLTASFLNGDFATSSGERVDVTDSEGNLLGDIEVHYGAGSSFDPNSVVLSKFLRPMIDAHWQQGNGRWQNLNRWDPARVPHNFDTQWYNVFVENGGIAELHSDVEIINLTLHEGNTITGDFDLAALGEFTWSGGSLEDGPNSEITVGGGRLSSSAEKQLSRTLVNTGSLDWEDGDLSPVGEGMGRLQNRGVLNITGDDDRRAWLDDTDEVDIDGIDFVNEAGATINKSGNSTVVLESGFKNDGVVNLLGGTLRIGSGIGDGSHGDFALARGTHLELDPDSHVFGGNITGPDATLTFLGGTTTIGDNPAQDNLFDNLFNVGTVLVDAGATVDINTTRTALVRDLTVHDDLGGSADMQVAEAFRWTAGNLSGGIDATTTLGAGTAPFAAHFIDGPVSLSRSLVNEGTLLWQSGSIGNDGVGDGVLHNRGAIHIAGSPESRSTAETGLQIINEFGASIRMVEESSSPFVDQIVTLNSPLENDGLITVTAGHLTIRNGRGPGNDSDGDFQVASGTEKRGVLKFRPGHDANAHTINGTVSGAAGNPDIAGTRVEFLGGTTNLNGRFNVRDVLVSGDGVNANFGGPESAQVGTFTMESSGQVGGTGDIVVNEMFRWTNGSLAGGLGTAITVIDSLNDVDARITAGAQRLDRTLQVEGTLELEASLESESGGAIVIDGFGGNNGQLNFRFGTLDSKIRVTNTGTMRKISSGNGHIQGAVDNFGTLEVVDGALVLDNLEQHEGTTLTRGTYYVEGTGLLDSRTGAISTNQAAVHLKGPEASFPALDTLADNQGFFQITDGKNFETVGDLTNSGDIVVGVGSRLTVQGTYTQTGTASSLRVDGEYITGAGAPATFADGAELTGLGVFGEAVIAENGIVSPGASPGMLTTGDFRLADNGVYRWELDSQGNQDLIQVDGTLTFGTTATLQLGDLGGSPNPFNEYVLFRYAPTDLDPTNPTWIIDNSLAPNWNVSRANVYVDDANDQVVLTGLAARLHGDFNDDGYVNASDFIVWRSTAGQTGPNLPADGDRNGSVGREDLNLWRTNFGRTAWTNSKATASVSTAAVPEPGSATLVGIIVLLAAAAPVASRQSIG